MGFLIFFAIVTILETWAGVYEEGAVYLPSIRGPLIENLLLKTHRSQRKNTSFTKCVGEINMTTGNGPRIPEL